MKDKNKLKEFVNLVVREGKRPIQKQRIKFQISKSKYQIKLKAQNPNNLEL